MLNLQIAKAYLAGTDNGMATRTWQQALASLTGTKQGANQHRWQTVARDKAFAPLLSRIIIETPGEVLLKVMSPILRNSLFKLRSCWGAIASSAFCWVWWSCGMCLTSWVARRRLIK